MSQKVWLAPPYKGRLRGLDIAGGAVEIDDESDFIQSTLHHGTLSIRSRRQWPHLTLSTLEDCQVSVLKRSESSQANLLGTRFVRCSFSGTLNQINFGNEPSRGETDCFGSVEDCDFTRARLDGCSFFNCSVSRLQFPAFPHVVIVSPGARRADIRRVAWPGALGTYMEVCADRPASLSACVFFLPRVCKLVKCSEAAAVAALTEFGLMNPSSPTMPPGR